MNDKKAFQIIRRKDWLILIALLCLAIGIACNMFLAKIMTTCDGYGILWCEKSTSSDNIPDYVYASIDSESVSEITPNSTKAYIECDMFNVNTYGYMTGVVESVSTRPVSESEMEDEGLCDVDAKYVLDKADSQYRVLIKLDTDDSGRPEFTLKQPETKPVKEEQCQVHYVISMENPYRKLFQ